MTGHGSESRHLRALRLLALALAGLAALLLGLIALNLAPSSPLRLQRFREPTWVLYGALALFALLREHPLEYLRGASARARAIFDSARFFPVASGVCLAIYLLSSITSHLSFHTFSHDFSMFDEALYQSHHGRLLFSPVLGRSFLTEHFSPLLLLLVPLHALVPNPYLLVLLHPLILWAAVVPLRALLDAHGVSRVARNIACVIYLTNPITTGALGYSFHIEVFLPLATFAVLLAHRTRAAWAYWALLALSLTIKEDVGIYTIGLGAYLFAAERRRVRGAMTALTGLAYVLGVLYIVTPRLSGAGYRFLDRWASWGADPFGVAIGMAAHPLAVLGDLAAPSYPLFFYRLAAIPFLTPWGWLLFAIPWVLTATSGLRQQVQLGIYYGLPLLTYAAAAAAPALGSPALRRIASSRWGAPLAALALMLNVAHFTFHRIPPERGAVLRELGKMPREATVQAMPCFFPVLGYERSKSLLMPGDRPAADYIVLRSEETTWPFAKPEVQRLAQEAMASRQYVSLYDRGGFQILGRRSLASFQ